MLTASADQTKITAVTKRKVKNLEYYFLDVDVTQEDHTTVSIEIPVEVGMVEGTGEGSNPFIQGGSVYVHGEVKLTVQNDPAKVTALNGIIDWVCTAAATLGDTQVEAIRKQLEVSLKPLGKSGRLRIMPLVIYDTTPANQAPALPQVPTAPAAPVPPTHTAPEAPVGASVAPVAAAPVVAAPPLSNDPFGEMAASSETVIDHYAMQ